jgi:hemolysin D
MSRSSKRELRRTNRADNEFLPAAVEILETPASPVRAAMIWLICLLVALSLVWAYFGKFDIVATAQGKIQPIGRVKIVQSEELGRVVTANSANGNRVRKGDILVELDPTTARAEAHALILRVQALGAEIARRQTEQKTVTAWAKTDIWTAVAGPTSFPIAFPVGTPASTAEREQQLYAAELTKLSGSIANLSAQRRKGIALVDRLEKTIVSQQAFISILSQRVSMRSTLVDAEAGTRAAVIDAQETLQEAERDLVSHKGEYQEAKSALDVLRSEAHNQFSIFQSENMQRLAEALHEAEQSEQELAKANRLLAAMTIRSPETGIVQASAVTTVGQVLAPGTELMRIVPSDQKLEIEAYLPNRDIGFIKEGHEAVIKVEAFPFTRYGILNGTVSRLATDAIPEPDARQLEEMPSENLQSSVPVSNAQRVQNLVYPVVVQPTQTDILVDGKVVPLTPGMTVTIEIKTGQRRILEYLFSPLAEIASGAMKER